MSYIIRVHFTREWSDDADLVEDNPEFEGLTYREAFKQQFHAELQEAFDRSEGALAGHFEIEFVKADPKNDKSLNKKIPVKSRKPRNALRYALTQIKLARDYCAVNGEYPYGTVGEDQSFDDWAAEVAEKALKGGK